MRTIKIAAILFFLLTWQALAVPNVMSISVSNANIDFQLIDPFGNITGYNPVQKVKLENIPNTRYVSVLPYEYYSQTPVGHEIHPIESSYDTVVPVGKYQFKIYNTSNKVETYGIDMKIGYFQNHNILTTYLPNKIIYPNSTWIYEFDVTSVPQGISDKSAAGVAHYNTLPIIKVSTPVELLKDIKAAGQLGYIGNPKFVKDLTERVAQVALLKGDQKKGYEDILSELTSLYSKPEQDRFIKKEGYDVLKEDLDYIISHL